MLEELTPRARRVLYIIPAWMAFLFLLAMYGLYALDMPYYDQWELVPLLEKVHAGTFSLGDVWAQHNEHRLVFPRLVMLGLAHLTDWNIYAELATNLVLALFTWMILFMIIRRSSAQVHEGENNRVYMAMTLIVFSVSQWQNWFLGWQLQEFMNVLAIVIALGCLSWQTHTSLGVGLALMAGVVATYSFANGILIWPIGLGMLVLLRSARPYTFRREAGAWGLVGFVVIVSYLYGYQTPPYHAPLRDALGQPRHVSLYFFAYLGQPLGNMSLYMALCMGAFGFLVWLVTLLQLVVCRVSLVALLPWIGMALYALGTAALTAVGRVDEGLEQALSSRYVTMANLLWLPVVVQVHWVAQVSEGRFIRFLLPMKMVVICVAVSLSSVFGAYRWTERYNAYSALRNEMLYGHDLDKLHTLYPPRPQVIVDRRVFLKEHALSIFGPVETPPTGE